MTRKENVVERRATSGLDSFLATNKERSGPPCGYIQNYSSGNEVEGLILKLFMAALSTSWEITAFILKAQNPNKVFMKQESENPELL